MQLQFTGWGTTALIVLLSLTSLGFPSEAFPAPVVRKVGKPYSQERFQPPKSIAKVQLQTWGDRPAATLSVREVPVFTFLDSRAAAVIPVSGSAKTYATKSPDTNKVATSPLSALSRATTAAAEINQLYQRGATGESITPTWDAQQGVYGIKVGDRPLLTLDRNTQFAGQVQTAEEEILQGINRLRQILGDAEPLKPEAIARLRPGAMPEPSASIGMGAIRQFFTEGLASWYGPGFQGRRTANGEIFDPNAMTAAHKSLPFGTWVRVTNLDNGRSALVRINDRGPFIRGREIDLSAGAAQSLGTIQSGVAPVRLEIVR